MRAPLLELFNRLSSMFIGPITGIFLPGVLTRRGNLTGVLVGAPVGSFLPYLLTSWTPLVENLNWMWTAPLSCLATLMVGHVASVVVPAPQGMVAEAESAAPAPAVGALSE